MLKTFGQLTHSFPACIIFHTTDLTLVDKEFYFGQKFIDIDFFIKVICKRFGGQEVLVGIDKDGPLGNRQYQITTFIPDGKAWIGDLPLSPVNRTALLALRWWKNSFKNDETIKFFKVCLSFILFPSSLKGGLIIILHRFGTSPPCQWSRPSTLMATSPRSKSSCIIFCL